MRKTLAEKPFQTLTFKAEDKGPEPNTIRNFFVEEIRGLYWTEKYLLKALPKIQDAASTIELKEILEDHSSVTDDHVERIEMIFVLLKEMLHAKKCEGMDGLIKETNHVIFKQELNDFTRDLGIVSMVKKIQNYQLALYDSLIHLAGLLRESVIQSILLRSLNEEKKALEVFTSLVHTHLNETTLLETESE
jgi:ferritin-like metal-binding protein YciE